MRYRIDTEMQFPLVEIDLERDEKLYIQPGSMVYHTSDVTLTSRLNAEGEGIGKLVKAVGRSVVSGESTFVTEVMSESNYGQLAIAPSTPGQVVALKIGEQQYRLKDSAFLALDGSAAYRMEKQSLTKALFSGQGGLFIMATEGEGTLLLHSFGGIKKIELQQDEITVSQAHVLAWSQDLDYDIHLENSWLKSVGNSSKLVNTFKGTGELYIQSLNVETFATVLEDYIAKT